MRKDHVYFFHMREHYPDGDNLKLSNMGGVTVAFKYYPETNNNNAFISWAASFCSPIDNFNKRLGRVKAEGRLQSPKHMHHFSIPEDATVEYVMNEIKEQVYKTREARDMFVRSYLI